MLFRRESQTYRSFDGLLIVFDGGGIVIVVASKRAFWDLEDVLSSVGIAKSSCCFNQNFSGTKMIPWN